MAFWPQSMVLGCELCRWGDLVDVNRVLGYEGVVVVPV